MFHLPSTISYVFRKATAYMISDVMRCNDSKTNPSISPSHPFPTFARLSSSELPPLSRWAVSWGSRWYVEPARDGPGTLPWVIRLWGEAGVDGADCKCFWKGNAAFRNETGLWKGYLATYKKSSRGWHRNAWSHLYVSRQQIRQLRCFLVWPPSVDLAHWRYYLLEGYREPKLRLSLRFDIMWLFSLRITRGLSGLERKKWSAFQFFSSFLWSSRDLPTPVIRGK